MPNYPKNEVDEEGQNRNEVEHAYATAIYEKIRKYVHQNRVSPDYRNKLFADEVEIRNGINEVETLNGINGVEILNGINEVELIENVILLKTPVIEVAIGVGYEQPDMNALFEIGVICIWVPISGFLDNLLMNVANGWFEAMPAWSVFREKESGLFDEC